MGSFVRVARPTVLAVLASVLLLVPVLQATPTPPAQEPDSGLPTAVQGVGGTDVVDRLMAIPSLEGDQRTLALLGLFQSRQGPGMAGALFPPEFTYRGVDPLCDLDGDGITDLVSNDLTLRRNGRFDSGFSFIRTLSGANGTQLWSADNQLYANLALQGAFTTERAGLANPRQPPNVAPLPDVDGDGVCDVFAYGLDQRGLVEPFLLGNPSVSYFDVTIRVLSGATGEPVWSHVVSAANIDYSMPLFGYYTGQLIVGFPTGFSIFDSPEGPRYVLKTTDLAYDYTEDPLGLTEVLTGDDPLYVANLLTAEHLIVGDAATGAPIWKRDFGPDAACLVTVSQTDPAVPSPGCAQDAVPGAEELSPSEPDNVNITWISGLGDLNGDGALDVVLDQLMLTNPRTGTLVNPVSGDKLYRYGRGMRMMALDGTDGSDLWSSILLDPLAVQVQPADETNQELLVWTFGRVLPDADGDGLDEPIAQYLAQEMVGATLNGKFRTHFLRLAPADGVRLWDHPQQGWGHIATLSPDRMALGSLDLPDRLTAGTGRFPEKALRVTGIDAVTGGSEWTYEERWALDSQSSYEIGLQQIHRSLAPLDVDGDGTKEVVTPSRYIAPEARSQVLLATARQDFLVLDGQSGKTVSTLDVWGPSGMLLPCVDGDLLTFVVGHGRRMDLVRVHAGTGLVEARQNIYSFSEPRSGLVGIDVLSLDGKCSIGDGRLAYVVNVEAFSFFRRYEIIPLLGILDADGEVGWRSPVIEEDPPTPSILETSTIAPSLLPTGAGFVAVVALAVVAGLGFGALVAIPVGKALARRKLRLDPLGLALLVLVVPPMAFDPADTAPAGDDLLDAGGLAALAGDGSSGPFPPSAVAPQATAASEADPTGSSTLGAVELVSRWSRNNLEVLRSNAAVGKTPDVSDRYGENETLAFPHVLGDMDGDGVDDVMLDVYCSGYAFTACAQPSYGLLDQPVASATSLFSPTVCGPYHQMVVVSGASGDRLWDVPMDTPLPVPNLLLQTACSAEAVVGTVPLPDNGMGILVYRFETIDALQGIVAQTYNHTLFLREGQTGTKLWSFSELGYTTPPSLFGVATTQAQTMLINPMLVVPDPTQVPDITNGAQLSLMVQGIGFRASDINTFVDPTFGALTGPPRATDEYSPIEWLARLDPQTGEVLWRVDSFLPEAGRSVLPMGSKESLFRDFYASYETHTSYNYPYDIPVGFLANEWGPRLCCGDLSGDGVFDPAFMTLEWSPAPNANVGPHALDFGLVAFDGATGARLWDTPLVTDQPVQQQRTPFWQYPYDTIHMRMESVGDTTGDGIGDVLLHQRIRYADFESAVALVDGKTGEVAWRVQLPQNQAVLPLGDANGDGGNDLLFLDWFYLEMYQEIQGDYTNATHNPLLVRNGATGQVLYETTTYAPVLDMVTAFANLARQGLPDLDRDGVGDYPVDDPIFLPDQIVLHQIHYLSGRDGHRLFTIPVAGAFGFTARLPDLNGDEVPELALLSGDAQDLWMSYRDGSDGSPLWGHRALAVRTADYAMAIPKMTFLPMRTGFWEGDVGFLSSLHMDTQEVAGEYSSLSVDGSGAVTSTRGLSIMDSTLPQINAILDPAGADSWSYPSGGDIALSRLDGETPGTKALLDIRTVAEPTTASLASRAVHDGWLPAAAFGAAFLAALAAVAIIIRRKGVPA